MYISVLYRVLLNFKKFFVYILLMCYCEFIDTFVVLSLKKCKNVNCLQTYILDLIKQTINNAMHNTTMEG
ncbi:hypothetical protein J2772_000323 [Chryseobacterium jejuense]|nr:hypothetical protein [Chryseobacterium jejuense]